MKAVARWCYHHRLAVFLMWIVALIAIVGSSQLLGSSYSSTFGVSGTDSTRAVALLESVRSTSAGDQDQIVW